MSRASAAFATIIIGGIGTSRESKTICTRLPSFDGASSTSTARSASVSATCLFAPGQKIVFFSLSFATRTTATPDLTPFGAFCRPFNSSGALATTFDSASSNTAA